VGGVGVGGGGGEEPAGRTVNQTGRYNKKNSERSGMKNENAGSHRFLSFFSPFPLSLFFLLSFIPRQLCVVTGMNGRTARYIYHAGKGKASLDTWRHCHIERSASELSASKTRQTSSTAPSPSPFDSVLSAEF